MSDPSRLHSRTVGDQGPRVAFVHGVFGQGRNWTQIAKGLAGHARCTLIDLPNHGHSPRTEGFSYADMADALATELGELASGERWILVGHSMGGKTAMLLALRHPELLAGLVVVDVSPVTYPRGRDFEDYVRLLKALPLERIATRGEADQALAADIPSDSIRGFLLQNLHRDHGHWSWRMNLDLIGESLGELGGWPAEAVPEGATYEGPVLWLAGANAAYVTPDYAEPMRALFPTARLVTVKNAGHWVHSEQPQVTIEALGRFISAVADDSTR
ncbi:MAG: alpha/beta fold hydrolase [Micrococcales bacterium]|nr:alpha/beta fold hydrolase [Micrococcales bacterium]